MRIAAAALLMGGALAMSGCVSTNATQLSANEVLITTEGALACGTGRTQEVAFSQAAVETLRRGFDGFVILDSARGSDRYLAGFNEYGPIYGGGYDQDFVVRMFRASDAGYGSAIDARGVLGPEWQTIMSEPQNWCFGNR